MLLESMIYFSHFTKNISRFHDKILVMASDSIVLMNIHQSNKMVDTLFWRMNSVIQPSIRNRID